MNKTLLGFLGIMSLLLAACVEQPGTGRAVFTITDAAAEMGAVTSVKVTVDSVRVHSSAEGWVTVSSTPQTYDLLQLKASGDTVVMADVQLKEGTYQQVRLDISKVVVTDASGEHEAKLPSGELKIVGEVEVKPETTAAVTFDFIADESLHVTGKGEYILAPVVQLETRSDADVEVRAGNKAEVKGGNVKTNVKVGMDIAGNVGVGLKIGLDEELEISGSEIKVLAKMIGKGKANASSNTSINVGVGG